MAGSKKNSYAQGQPRFKSFRKLKPNFHRGGLTFWVDNYTHPPSSFRLNDSSSPIFTPIPNAWDRTPRVIDLKHDTFVENLSSQRIPERRIWAPQVLYALYK